jgi:hypothetical protein
MLFGTENSRIVARANSVFTLVQYSKLSSSAGKTSLESDAFGESALDELNVLWV